MAKTQLKQPLQIRDRKRQIMSLIHLLSVKRRKFQ